MPRKIGGPVAFHAGEVQGDETYVTRGIAPLREIKCRRIAANTIEMRAGHHIVVTRACDFATLFNPGA
ncbi:hypothetical protein [Burkholderia sp. Bp8998]|uniref:hypothetical protein n=1 Tax=Burkholderia sp. Bp8998 TaxID=2184557 RepID=UPI0016397C60|nr:hypothetical protein [Burkholderia sp. Bp8998]